MTIQEACNFFESLVSEASRKSEIKVYQEFIQIITGLENKNLSESKIQSIETELKSLNLKSNPENRKKYFKKTLSEFKTYLKDTFSLTPKGYYTNIGISTGAAFGIVAGVVFGERFEKSLGIALGISIGMVIGSIVGRHMDSNAEAAGNMI